jgi:hypothetical protein
LWDFQKSKYHAWVQKENIDKRFASILPSGSSIPITFPDHEIEVGIGLHDSSAALIPYLSAFHEPFVLISTGTWCVSLNPFNHTGLTDEELKQDSLCYLSYDGKPVKASRLFAGYEHEQQVKRMAAHFQKAVDYYQGVECDTILSGQIQSSRRSAQSFSESDLGEFNSYEEAYHHLMWNIIEQQIKSTNLVVQGTSIKKIFVDGGFGKIRFI